MDTDYALASPIARLAAVFAMSEIEKLPDPPASAMWAHSTLLQWLALGALWNSLGE